MCHRWMIKYSDISMDVNVPPMDDEALCYQGGCQCHPWMIKYSTISMDDNVS